MGCSAYISWLAQAIPGADYTRAQLVDAVNRGQNRILSRETRSMRIVPDPYLITTAGTYQYTASTAIKSSLNGTTTYDIRRVSKVYMLNNKGNPFTAYNGADKTDYKPSWPENPYGSPVIHVQVDTVTSKEPLKSDCQVIFWRDRNPGATTAIYNVECYRWPTQVLSESVDLEIPVQWRYNLLYMSVLDELNLRDFGNDTFEAGRFEQLLADFLTDDGRGATTDVRRTLPREC